MANFSNNEIVGGYFENMEERNVLSVQEDEILDDVNKGFVFKTHSTYRANAVHAEN